MGLLDLQVSEPSEPQPVAESDSPVIRSSYPVLAQTVVGFAFGVFLSPYSTGIWFAVGYLAAYELFVYVTTRGSPEYYDPLDRAGIVAAYILGWIVGRILAGQEVFGAGPASSAYVAPPLWLHAQTPAAKLFARKYGAQ